MIDFRSDTVTKPTPEMRQVMIEAEVGDDVFQEDPTVILLQNKVAEMFGKPASLFCSSGTQTNQIAINVLTSPGGEVICHQDSHVFKYEGGGIAKNSSVSCRILQGSRGMINAEQIEEWINPDDVHYPVTQLVCVEDTSNRGGGAVYSFEELQKIKEVCVKHHLALHLDGARIFNTLTVNGIEWKAYAQLFDSISICLSKGLGAPIGSVLLGSEQFIKQARRVRKVLGGGMRQVGMIAAAGIYALDHHIERLHIDHLHAKRLEECALKLDWIKEVIPVDTNIVVMKLRKAENRDIIIKKLKENGILCMAFGFGMLRFVTHLDITSDMIDKTISTLNRIQI